MKDQVFQDKKILVTGGAGFIGSHLVAEFLDLGAHVICLDNLSTGKRKNLDSFKGNNKFNFIKGDIRNYDDCLSAAADCDYISHQAALGSVPRSLEDPRTTNEVNISGFLNVLEVTRHYKIKRMVYAASSSTYGDSQSLPKIEEAIGQPLSPYAVTKYVNELYAHVYSLNYNIETIGLRYFNVFGPRQDKDGAYAAVIPKFIAKLINHKSPKINGDGSYSRDFTYIKNVIQANVLALTIKDKSAINEVYNVACGARTTINELVELLKLNLSRYDPDICAIFPDFGSKRAGDVSHSLAAIDKIQKKLGYDPVYNIEEGLSESIDWYWDEFQTEEN